MKKWFFIFLMLPSAAFADCVVLLHGLARSSGSFYVLEKALTTQGYETVNVDYPSTSHEIEILSDVVGQSASTCQSRPVHFVTHSLGGILVRHWFENHTIDDLGRVVMLAPPNHGSQVVDALREMPGFSANGPAVFELGAEDSSVPNTLGPVSFDVGVIAGNQSINPFFSTLVPGPDDGSVSVESTQVEGMSDHIVLPVTHTFLMNDPEVIFQVLSYLDTGAFDEEASAADIFENLVPYAGDMVTLALTDLLSGE